MFQKFLLGAFLLGISLSSMAQQDLNLDFEVKSVEGAKRPWGWSLLNWGPVQFRMDSTQVQSGRYSLKASCPEKNCPKQSLDFSIEPYSLQGKTLEISTEVKSLVEKGKVGISFGYNQANTHDDNFTRYDTSLLIPYKKQWDTYSFSYSIPEQVQSVFITLHYEGTGDAWFDHISIKADGKEIKTSVPVAAPFSKKERKVVQKQLYPLDQFAPYPSKQTTLPDYSFLDQLIGESKIVALGEATHGTSEFFALKHQMLQYLALKKGFRIFAIEDNQVLIRNVNKYVLTGEGSAQQSMRGMFAVWYNEEVKAMIEWVRYFNETHPDDPIYFVGIDMQDFNRPYEHLLSFIKERAPHLNAQAESAYEDFKLRKNESFTLADSIKKQWLVAAESLLKELKAQETSWLKTANSQIDSVKILEGIQSAQLLHQHIKNIYLGYWALYRDEAMANNVTWLLEKRYPGRKMVLWAHDVHISECRADNDLYDLSYGGAMGGFLHQRYSDDYKSFGIATYTGAYHAQISYTDLTKVSCSLVKSPIGSLDEVLHQISRKKNKGTLFLSLKDITFKQPLPFRFANHVSIDYSYWQRISVAQQFDGLFFIDQTNPARPLPK